jgi:hypothetical protein
MWRIAQIFGAGPRRQNPKHVVDLHRVCVDDDTIFSTRQIRREPRLAAGGRPRYQDCIPDAACAAFLSGLFHAAHCNIDLIPLANCSNRR